MPRSKKKRKRLDWQKKWKHKKRQRIDEIAALETRDQRLRAILALPIIKFKLWRFGEWRILAEEDTNTRQTQHALVVVLRCFSDGLEGDYNYRFTRNKEYQYKRSMPVVRLLHHLLNVNICTSIIAPYLGDPNNYDYYCECRMQHAWNHDLTPQCQQENTWNF